jgi:hypothetical protein
MPTKAKTDPKQEAQLKSEAEAKRNEPVLKDLEADAEKADKVVGGPMRCVSRGGC